MYEKSKYALVAKYTIEQLIGVSISPPTKLPFIIRNDFYYRQNNNFALNIYLASCVFCEKSF